jgi:hypothetical protein
MQDLHQDTSVKTFINQCKNQLLYVYKSVLKPSSLNNIYRYGGFRAQVNIFIKYLSNGMLKPELCKG